MRRQVYGRGKHRHVPGTMGKLELAYAAELERQRRADLLVRYDYEPERLRLADKTYYVPDFRVVRPDGRIEFHELKPRKNKKKDGKIIGETYFSEDKSKAKVKIAAEMHPYWFAIVFPLKAGGWQTLPIGGDDGSEET